MLFWIWYWHVYLLFKINIQFPFQALQLTDIDTNLILKVKRVIKICVDDQVNVDYMVFIYSTRERQRGAEIRNNLVVND